MKIRNAIILLIVLVFSLSLLAGCKQTPITPPPVNEKSCVSDSDCACGKHKSSGECFFGNKAFVNVEDQCPDFCTGIAAHLEIKCIDKECKQVRIEPAAECATDNDCKPGQCCHPTTCVPGTEQPECAAVSCDASCQAGTLDCGGSCTCEDGKCTANLNNITPPTSGKCTTDSDCVASECCHPTQCVTTDKQPDCAAVSCTAVCAPGTLDCGGSCTCENEECIANLNDYTQEEPIPTGACTTDDDCVPAECCHAAECTTKDNKPDCTAVLCSQECRGQTMDCGGFCACIGGRCIAELNDL